MSLTYISPTEPLPLRDIGKTSMRPEYYGCDVLIHGLHSTLGVQRKTVSDLLASLDDGRLAEQLTLMGALDHRIIVVEGPLHWVDGKLHTDGWGSSISRKGLDRVLMSVRSTGCHVEYTRSLEQTIEWVQVMGEWADAEHHSTLQPVSQRVRGSWGERNARHYQIQMLTAMPGIGAGLASRIIDTVGFPLALVRDLSGVRGLGAKKISDIENLFTSEQD